MNCEGVWKVEITTPYGWERIGTAFMQNGQYLAASANHYSIGRYSQDGEDVEITTAVTQYGDFRTVFGREGQTNLHVTSKCRIEDNEIVGKSKAKGKQDYDILIRLTRLGDID